MHLEHPQARDSSAVASAVLGFAPVIRPTPFHARTSALNETGLWSHWAGHLAANRYQASDKLEYFAVRNAAGIFDTSPLYKYRITGRDAERFLAGVLARDIRACRAGHAQYTTWCDDRGFVMEDGVVFRHCATTEFLLTAAPSRTSAGFARPASGGCGSSIEDVTDEYGDPRRPGSALARPARAAGARGRRRCLLRACAEAKIGSAPVTVSRTGYTGDLGLRGDWVDAGRRARPSSTRCRTRATATACCPFGEEALCMLRIEAGLLLLASTSTRAGSPSTTRERSTPNELGWAGCSRASPMTTAPSSAATRSAREIADRTSRWANERPRGRLGGLGPRLPRGRADPAQGRARRCHEDGWSTTTSGARVGYATSFMYSPVLQRHIAPRPGAPRPGEGRDTGCSLEFTVDHHYEKVAAHVARLPFFNPADGRRREPWRARVRRDRGRRRPQRPGQRRLPGQGAGCAR